MAAHDPERRRLSAQIASAARWAHDTDREGQGRRGQAGLRRRFEREVDPDGRLAPELRTKMVDAALQGHMARMRLAGAKKRADERRAS